MKRSKHLLAYLLILTQLAVSSCATLFTGTSQKVYIDSDPPGADIYIDNMNKGQTPSVVKIQKNVDDVMNGGRAIRLEKEGYRSENYMMSSGFNGISILNNFILLFWAIDVATGAVYKFDSNVKFNLIPGKDGNFPNTEQIKMSATGFAVNNSGYVVTNYHVIEQANRIKVKGLNGDFSKAIDAEIVLEDANNDICVLKVPDSIRGEIPYGLASKSSEVGKSVYVLGYPLRTSMGDEIKLTNGIISSKTGFQGDPTSYQISAPVQNGNSGGPVFDDYGNIIGIVNAKHLKAENASYCIKINYLKTLLESLETAIELPENSDMSELDLSRKTSLIKDYVYLIEIY